MSVSYNQPPTYNEGPKRICSKSIREFLQQWIIVTVWCKFGAEMEVDFEVGAYLASCALIG